MEYATVIFLIVISFFVNLPMGMWRVNVNKFSVQWFFAVHLSVPLLFYLRTHFDVGAVYIPVLIAAAVIGQLLGGKLLIYWQTKYKLKKGTA